MVLRIHTFKIRGSRPTRGAARPDIFILLDEDKIGLRREATTTLDPLESAFTIAEAQDLSNALLELLKLHAAETAAKKVNGAPPGDEGVEAGDVEDEDDASGIGVDRTDQRSARIAVAFAP